MGLSYFSRDLPDSSEVPGLDTQGTENSSCAAWQDRDALSGKENPPRRSRGGEAERFAFSDMVKGSF